MLVFFFIISDFESLHFDDCVMRYSQTLPIFASFPVIFSKLIMQFTLLQLCSNLEGLYLAFMQKPGIADYKLC